MIAYVVAVVVLAPMCGSELSASPRSCTPHCSVSYSEYIYRCARRSPDCLDA
jgi:hypothetical protein